MFKQFKTSKFSYGKTWLKKLLFVCFGLFVFFCRTRRLLVFLSLHPCYFCGNLVEVKSLLILDINIYLEFAYIFMFEVPGNQTQDLACKRQSPTLSLGYSVLKYGNWNLASSFLLWFYLHIFSIYYKWVKWSPKRRKGQSEVILLINLLLENYTFFKLVKFSFTWFPCVSVFHSVYTKPCTLWTHWQLRENRHK